MRNRLSRVLASLIFSRVRTGRIEVVEGARRRGFGPEGAALRATVTIRDPAAWRSPLRGSIGLGEAYVDGLWEADDLVALMRIAARELRRLDRLRGAVARPRGLLHRLRRLVPDNTRRAAKRHIAAHYDLGNDLFTAFLDERMMYSCAYSRERTRAWRRRSWRSWSGSASDCGCGPRTTCWRSAPAGAASRSTPPASAAAG